MQPELRLQYQKRLLTNRLQKLSLAILDKDMDDELYLWEYDNVEIQSETDWTVSGWIGALNRTTPDIDGIDRGIVLMARGNTNRKN